MNPRPVARVVRVGTGGMLVDRRHAIQKGNQLFPPATERETVILDLGYGDYSVAALQDLIVPLAQRVRSGLMGPMDLIISAPDPGIRGFIGYLAVKYDLSIFLTSAPDALQDARPAGDLTATELATLEIILTLGGAASASNVARRVGIEVTAAGNRLANLEKKGYVYRIRTPGREADLFSDPRSAYLPKTAP